VSAEWVVVARIPQVGGGVREVLVERTYAAEVRAVLRQDPARIDGLWCPRRTREVRSQRRRVQS
jgi:hypothetical protein